MLKLNDSKTEFLIIVSRQQLVKVNADSVQVGASKIFSASALHNFGVWFDKNVSMEAHVVKNFSKAFFGLKKIRQIRKFLSEDATKTLVHAFVTHIPRRLVQLPALRRVTIPTQPITACH